MNWANRLTLARLALTILFVFSLSSAWQYGRTIALILFVAAGVTDYFDGEIARRYAIITKFGKLMDPLVDKVMIAAGFICLVPLGAVPAWVATIVVARDFLITGLRLLASSEGLVLPAERLGKHKTSWQIATVAFFLLLPLSRPTNSSMVPAGRAAFSSTRPSGSFSTRIFSPGRMPRCCNRSLRNVTCPRAVMVKVFIDS